MFSYGQHSKCADLLNSYQFLLLFLAFTAIVCTNSSYIICPGAIYLRLVIHRKLRPSQRCHRLFFLFGQFLDRCLPAHRLAARRIFFIVCQHYRTAGFRWMTLTHDASEHGANASFGGGHSRDVALGTKSVRRSQGIGEASGNQNGESEAKAGISEKKGWDRRSASGWTIRENLAAFLGESPAFPGPLKMRVLPQRVVLFTALDAALLGKGTPSGADLGGKPQDTGSKAGRSRSKTGENKQDIHEKGRK